MKKKKKKKKVAKNVKEEKERRVEMDKKKVYIRVGFAIKKRKV